MTRVFLDANIYFAGFISKDGRLKITSPRLRRIFACLRGAAEGAYPEWSVTDAATKKEGKKTSKVGEVIFRRPLRPLK